MTERANDFARLYTELLGEPRGKSTAAERARLLLRHRERTVRRTRFYRRARFLLPLGATLVSAFATALWFAAPSSEWHANSRGGRVVAGALLVPAANEALTVDFTDGSEVSLEPNAEATLRGLDETQTDLLLHEGRLSARVRPRAGASFRVVAGPYEVRVTGTTFTVEWDRSAGFRVAVAEGSVEISGGDLPATGVRIAAGEEFSRRGSSEPSASERPASVTGPVDDAAPERATGPLGRSIRVTDLPRVVESDERATLPSRPKPSLETSSMAAEEPDEPTPPSKPEWVRLAEAAEYAGALERAEAAGFGQLVERSSSSELLLLANAARYARNAERAKQAYNGIRRRFPSSNAARLSAYYLARLSGDLERQPRSEARWLETYLAEAPRGELAASARARLIELLRGSGDLAGARSIARDYLRYHPSGPHAEGARVLLEGSTDH